MKEIFINIAQLAVLICLSLAFIALLCKVLSIPLKMVIEAVPDEPKTKEGFTSLIGFGLFLIFVSSLVSHPHFINAGLRLVFQKYEANTGQSLAINVNQAIWAAVTFFLGNFLVLGMFKKR